MKWVHLNYAMRIFYRTVDLLHLRKVLNEHFERGQIDIAEPVTLRKHPVFVKPRQKVALIQVQSRGLQFTPI